jgi:hypothetical protein
MNRRKFLGIAGGTIVVAGVTYYLLSDKNNFIRADITQNDKNKIPIKDDESHTKGNYFINRRIYTKP